MPTIAPPLQIQIPVLEVRVVTNVTAVHGRVSENHYMLLFVLSKDPERSIRCNMRTDPDDTEGILEWTSHDFLISTQELKHWTFQARNLTPSKIVEYIYANHLHQFIFSGGGSGCTHWVQTLMSFFNQKGNLVTPLGNLFAEMEFSYHKSRGPRPQNWRRGTFLRPGTPGGANRYMVKSAHGFKSRGRSQVEGLFFLDARNKKQFVPEEDWSETNNADYIRVTVEGNTYVTDSLDD